MRSVGSAAASVCAARSAPDVIDGRGECSGQSSGGGIDRDAVARSLVDRVVAVCASGRRRRENRVDNDRRAGPAEGDELVDAVELGLPLGAVAPECAGHDDDVDRGVGGTDLGAAGDQGRVVLEPAGGIEGDRVAAGHAWCRGRRQLVERRTGCAGCQPGERHAGGGERVEGQHAVAAAVGQHEGATGRGRNCVTAARTSTISSRRRDSDRAGFREHGIPEMVVATERAGVGRDRSGTGARAAALEDDDRLCRTAGRRADASRSRRPVPTPIPSTYSATASLRSEEAW